MVISGNYTFSQIENATASQVIQIGGFSLEEAGEIQFFWEGIKRLLLIDFIDRRDGIRMEALKTEAQTWLDANFPNWQATRGRESDKPYVTIWLEGKPEDIDNG